MWPLFPFVLVNEPFTAYEGMEQDFNNVQTFFCKPLCQIFFLFTSSQRQVEGGHVMLYICDFYHDLYE